MAGRVVVVDTGYVNSRYFGDHFGNYFQSLQSKLKLSVDCVAESLDRMDVFPACLRGRVSTYAHVYDRDARRFCDADTKLPLTFDFSRDHPQELLVHQQAGGSRSSPCCG